MNLRKLDLEKIQRARNILVRDLKNPPTIEELAMKAGINRQKLKKGFKLIYEATINKYLRNERLEQASLLLLTDKTVKEAAEQVGYMNKSYFAKIFKEKYGVLPREYVKSIHLKINNEP